MKKNMPAEVTQRNQRRLFFGRLLATIGGGFIGGSLLKTVFNSGSEEHRTDKPINVNVHPLAVPRTKEGSKSHV
jgi:hypothetical protein